MRARIGLPERYALFVGRLVRQKGIFDLLVAYAKLPMAVRDAVGLVFAGDGTERQELLGRSPDVEPGKVVFTGFLQRDDLPAIYALAEVLVLPTYSDTWGLVVNEAMACGVPVIASRVAGCVADLVKDGENGYVVEAGNTESLAEAMTKILTGPSRRDHMGECGRRMSGDFTPDDWAQGIVRAVAGRNGDSLG